MISIQQLTISISAGVTLALSAEGAWFETGQYVSADDAVDFVRDIRPILKSRCIECHGPAKRKGKLRLDARSELFKGEDSKNWVVQPGDPENSELFYRVSLPADDFDIMPADGDPLTPEQVELFRRWILEGAEWPEGADIQVATVKEERIAIPELTEAQKAAEAKAIERLKKRGVLVSRIAANTEAIYVNFSLAGDEVTNDDISLLDGLQPSLAWLNLGRTHINSEGIEPLASFKELRRLHLQGTRVDDSGLGHIANLEHLTYLNLFGTDVSDAGMKSLEQLKQLKHIYLWGTRVTAEGARALHTALPEARVDLGDYALADAKPVKTLPPDATCCEKALFAGTTCDHPCCVEAAKKGEVCLKCNPSGVIRGKSK